jgi:methionyl-tRNA synthetase
MLTYTSHTKEMNFSWKLFQERVNNEVVNNLGNFMYRSLHLSQKQFGGVPEGEVEGEIKSKISETIEIVTTFVESYDFKGAVDAILSLSAWGNTYIQSKEPWKLAKTDPAAMAQVMRNCLQLVKALTLLIEPVMPERAALIWTQLGKEGIEITGFDEGLVELVPGPLPTPSIVFTKIDDKMTIELDSQLRERIDALDAEKKPQTPQVTIEEFAKVEMKTGKILSAEPVPKSSKLLKLQVNLGDEIRQIVSGIAQFHKPEDLIGKDVVVCSNLKPAKIFGIESNGMILAAGDEASLLKPETMVSPGTKIR